MTMIARITAGFIMALAILAGGGRTGVAGEIKRDFPRLGGYKIGSPHA